MRYVSTRGGVQGLSFSDAVMMGLADDGGLLVPETIPDVSKDLAQLAGKGYVNLAAYVMGHFIDDIPADDLRSIIERSYETFDDPEVTPLVTVGDFHVLELFHGPTLAFKDVALQFLGNIFEYVLSKRGGRLNILGATSGDTGERGDCGRSRQTEYQYFHHVPGRQNECTPGKTDDDCFGRQRSKYGH